MFCFSKDLGRGGGVLGGSKGVEKDRGGGGTPQNTSMAVGSGKMRSGAHSFSESL